MTEEEKKAIEYLKDYIKSDLNYFTIDFNNNLRISMNLIEKLQKENEELRVQGSIILLDYNILKDKIKEKLERLENQKENYKEQPLIYMLLKNQYKELLEEE